MSAQTVDIGSGFRTASRLPKPYSALELSKLERALASDPRLAAACTFLAETGLRISELVAITDVTASAWPRPHRWCRSCRRHRAVLRVIGKGNTERMVPLTPRALRAAHSLLPSRNGRLLPWTERTFRRHLALAGDRAGVHAHPHRFRHTYATRLVNDGAAIEVVADLLGHTNIQITRLYFRLSEERAFAAVSRRRRGRISR